MRPFRFLAVLVAAFAFAAAAYTRVAPTSAAGSPTWRDTGIAIPGLRRPLCIDPTNPHTVFVPDEDRGTIALDWQTGARSVLNSRVFDLCSVSGWLYASDNMGRGPFYRFRFDAPTAQPIDHPPTHLAMDGSPYVYSLSAYSDLPHRHLWASPDAGRTWVERGQQFGGRIEDLLVAATDGRALYALVLGEGSAAPDQVQAGIYASLDAGATWERRTTLALPSHEQGGNTRYLLAAVPGPTTPVDMLTVFSDTPLSPYSHRQEILLSSDGGRTFHSLGAGEDWVALAYTHEGVVRLTQQIHAASDFRLEGERLDLSTDGGRTWLPLAPPPAPTTPQGPDYLIQAPAAPANLFLYGEGTPLKYSPDGGHTWQQFTGATDWHYYLTPYLPLSVLGVKLAGPSGPGPFTPVPDATPGGDVTPVPGDNPNNHLFVLDLPGAGTREVAPAPPSNAPGSRYFAETGHNLAGVFRAYWEAHGGLAQFGYPRTEPVREVNAADGKVYLAQYFERNRFEYHPEFAGGPYEVELGLLGNEQTAARRAAGEGAFNRFGDAHYPGGVYFPQTGHNLRNSFQTYWEQHGGLAIYGYPISEEFEERSPTDGKTYVVQYFERNRFEWHPENKGTPYEVLLGLLGNTLLEAKGWR
jgi:hypothetical protein